MSKFLDELELHESDEDYFEDEEGEDELLEEYQNSQIEKIYKPKDLIDISEEQQLKKLQKPKKIKKNKQKQTKQIYEEPTEEIKKDIELLQNVNFQQNSVNCYRTHFEKLFETEENIGRKDYAIASLGNVIFIHGGFNGNKLLNDLISFSVDTEEWNMYQFNSDEMVPPAASGHFMFYGWGGLNLYYGGVVIYQLKNALDLEKRKWEKLDVRSTFCKLPYFNSIQGASVFINSMLYTYGGKSSSTRNPNSQMWRYEIERQGYGNTSKEHITIWNFSHKSGQLTPGMRYGHTMTSVNESIYLFGGFDEKNKEKNDLWQFVTGRNKWCEIQINSLPPPSLSYGSMMHIGSGNILMIGGIHDQKLQKDIYKYNVQRQEWYIVNVMGYSLPTTTSPNEYQKTICSHQLVTCSDSSIFIFGGMSSKSKYNSETYILHDTIDAGKNEELLDFISEQRKKGIFTDVMFRTVEKDGSFAHIEAHKCIVASRCDYLDKILSKELKVEEFSGNRFFEVAMIENCDKKVFKTYIDFLYTGNLKIDGKEEIDNLVKFAKNSAKNMSVIEKLCTVHPKSLYINEYPTLEFVSNCFEKLMSKNSFSDVTVELVDSETGELTNFYLHKVFLNRCPHFENMFKSGMSESTENIINLQEFTKEGFLQVLLFIYTGKIIINPTNCLEILVYSIFLQLGDLKNYCSGIVSNLITPQNVFDILSISDLYNESSLKRNCVQFISNNHEQFEENEIDKLSEDVRYKVKSKISQKEMKK
eukprot:gene6778-10942_t